MTKLNQGTDFDQDQGEIREKSGISFQIQNGNPGVYTLSFTVYAGGATCGLDNFPVLTRHEPIFSSGSVIFEKMSVIFRLQLKFG